MQINTAFLDATFRPRPAQLSLLTPLFLSLSIISALAVQFKDLSHETAETFLDYVVRMSPPGVDVSIRYVRCLAKGGKHEEKRR